MAAHIAAEQASHHGLPLRRFCFWLSLLPNACPTVARRDFSASHQTAAKYLTILDK